jgi:CubicO group peptidase (beta-lactamase class C family)
VNPFVPLTFLAAYCLTMALPAAEFWPLPRDLAPAVWTVAGPFAQEIEGRPAGVLRHGLDRDYLAPLGGEAALREAPAAALLAPLGVEAVHTVATPPGGVLDLRALLSEADFRVAYAWAVIESAAEQEVEFRFGSDDGAKVWVEGREVWRLATPGRAVQPGQDVFAVPLRAGPNRVLVKVENGTGGWGFALSVFDEEGRARAAALAQRRHLSALRLRPQSRTGYLLFEERFPRLAWEDPAAAAVVFATVEPQVVWFGDEGERVETPSAPGRYFAHVVQPVRDGHRHEQLIGFYRPRESSWDPAIPPFGPAVTMTLPPGLVYYRSPEFYAGQSAELSRQLWAGLGHLLFNEEAGAAFLSWAETAPDQAPTENFAASSFNEWMAAKLRLRLRWLGRTPQPLAPVAVESPAAPVLRRGSEAEAGMAPGTVERLRTVLRDWVADDPRACRAIVVRRGVVFFEEAVGNDFGRPAEVDQPFPPASIGKLVAGVLMGRFLEQGRLRLDDPLGTVLPGWPVEGERAVTFRQCFAHLSGLGGHVSHDGLFNPLLDQAFAVADLPFVTPGVARLYGGDGNNLAGKALELLTGRTVFELLHENIQAPLAAEDTLQVDLGFGSAFRPLFLARLGQMLLNGGAYGDRRFFSAATLAELLPRPQQPYNPGLAADSPEWGVGIEWMHDIFESGQQPVAGGRVYGHGSASTSVFRVDPERELVVVVGRMGTTDWGVAMRHTRRFMAAVVEGCQ